MTDITPNYIVLEKSLGLFDTLRALLRQGSGKFEEAFDNARPCEGIEAIVLKCRFSEYGIAVGSVFQGMSGGVVRTLGLLVYEARNHQDVVARVGVRYADYPLNRSDKFAAFVMGEARRLHELYGLTIAVEVDPTKNMLTPYFKRVN